MEDIEAYLIEKTGTGFEVKNYRESDLVVSKSNLHPSKLQHRMATGRIMQDMESLGIIERLLAR